MDFEKLALFKTTHAWCYVGVSPGRYDMKSGKYARNIELLCSTCGGTQFKYGDDIDAEHASVRCIFCDREMTKDELIHENSENIDEHVSEIGNEAVNDLSKEMKKSLKQAFTGNKHIKIK